MTESIVSENGDGGAWLSTLDILILVSLMGLGIYWLFLRKKKEVDDASFSTKTFSIEPTISKASDSSFIGKMKSSGRTVVVFYGSQTGTAEEFAARLAKEAKRFGLKAMVADPEESEMEELPKLAEIENSLVIFCMATYGEGDPTDNAQSLYEWLQAGDADLTGINYTVFGLGNKTYEHYNSMATYIDKRLEELGASRTFELGLGDDDANIEDDFITWKDRFWSAVCQKFEIENAGEDVTMRQYELVTHKDLPEEKVFKGEMARLNTYKNQKPPYDQKNPFLAPLTAKRELFQPECERSCLHIEVDISNSRLKYDAGDHIAVYPTNNPELVDKFGKLLNVDLDEVISLKNLDEDSSKKFPFPCPCSYRTALLHYVDIMGLPRTHIVKEISDYATNEEEKEKLKLMSSPTDEGKALFNNYVTRDCRSILHILEDMPSCRPPLDHILELLPRLYPRYYSISSSPKLYPTSVHITAVVVDYITPTGRHNQGVATSWLKEKQIVDPDFPRVPAYIRRSQFRLPSKPQTPIIMIGPGTGLAPFRGFIQERHHLKTEGKPVGETILYYGCRQKKLDFLYQEELEKFVSEGTLTMHVAFSRDQKEKEYVTHLLKKNQEDVWKIIGVNAGHLYVCGDAKVMARDVREIILQICEVQGKMSKQQAEEYVKKMESQRRYSSDVWS